MDAVFVYLDHGMTSFHMMLREGALDHYDTIFCYGPNHIEEIRAMEKVYGLPEKKLVKTGYGLLDQLLQKVEGLPESENEIKRVLIAPSWQKDNLLEFCLNETLDPLLEQGFQVTVRPHPEFVKRFPGRMKAILDKYGDCQQKGLTLETDLSSNATVYTSDIVITDWSSIAQEFSYATKKPSVFINTPMKIMNPEYKKIPLEPLDISLRTEIGIAVDVENLDKLPAYINQLLSKREEYRIQITQVLEKNTFCLGKSGQASGEYIIQTLQNKAVSLSSSHLSVEPSLCQ
jgi:YidC/Oxa1 family membrane protein insertase